MKSSFLFLLLFAMTVPVAFAQVSSKATTFDRFYERLKVGYFGVLTTPNVRNIGRGEFDNAALSPEFSGGTNKDSWPTNIWHQLSFNYNYGGTLNFVINPRFMTPIGEGVDMKYPEDRSAIMLDDVLVGFQGVIFSTDDKKFNLWIRPGIRLPTSQFSRRDNNRGVGRTTHQLEVAYLPTYDFNKTWQIGLFGQLRQWVVEDNYGFDRFRIITNPFIQYTINDVSRIQVYYDNILETNRLGKPEGDRNPVFTDRWQDILIGYNRDITPKFNIFPYVAAFVNDVPFSTESVYFGSWLSYQIK